MVTYVPRGIRHVFSMHPHSPHKHLEKRENKVFSKKNKKQHRKKKKKSSNERDINYK